MRHFRFYSAENYDEASAVLTREPDSQLIAGGTDLLGAFKDAILADSPSMVVSLEKADGTQYVRDEGDKIAIGAMTKLARIAENEQLRRELAAVAEAAYSVASPLIRNRATIGGNLCQDVRCWFYRYPNHGGGRIDCMRKGGAECYAIRGDNRYHSVFGGMKACATPCSIECPAGTDIPAYMDRLRKHDKDGAAAILMSYNPLPMMTSRVCAHTCQTQCNRNSTDESVAIHLVERVLGDHVLKNIDKYYKKPEKETGIRIAIAGAGPAGLTAAYFLRSAGHDVTVFDEQAEAGGCLMYAIPAFRLPKHYVRDVVKALKDMGIVFRHNTRVGRDVTAEELESGYDKVFYATGAWGRPVLGFDGEEFTEFGLQFLVEVNKWVNKKERKEVLVVGGGNVSMDVAITAKRLGANSVTLACLEQRREMPASAEEVERAIEEGIKIHNGYGVKRVIYDGDKLIGMELMRCVSVRDETGRFNPTYDENETMTIEADSILMAAGQRVDLSFIEEKYELAKNRGLIKVDSSQKTSRPNIFAGGDATTGPTTVIKGIRTGRNAAEAINTELGVPNPVKPTQHGFIGYAEGCASMKCAVKPIELSAADRAIDKEDSHTISDETCAKEVKRCMNCGCYSVNASDLSPVMVALGARLVTNRRVIDAEDFFTTELKAYDKLDRGEIITEIVIPKHTGYVTHYEKFRLRNAIDFAMTSLASAYKLADDGTIEDISLVLGAVAPVPMRARRAEALLLGKKPTPELAEEAGEAAAYGAHGIGHNQYKVQVIKSFVKRLVLSMIKND